jgi:hypothetical protein
MSQSPLVNQGSVKIQVRQLSQLSSGQMVNNNEAIAVKTRSRHYLPSFFCNIEIDKPQISLS